MSAVAHIAPSSASAQYPLPKGALLRQSGVITPRPTARSSSRNHRGQRTGPGNTVFFTVPSVTPLAVESVAPPDTVKKTVLPGTGAPLMSTMVAVNWNELLVWAVIAPDWQSRAPLGVGYWAEALLGAIWATANIASITAARGMMSFLFAWLVLLVSRTCDARVPLQIRGATLALRHPCLPAAPTGCGTGRLKD